MTLNARASLALAIVTGVMWRSSLWCGGSCDTDRRLGQTRTVPITVMRE